MTQLNQNRYDQLLRRVGDLKGPGSKVNDALTELFPVIDVENVPAELLLLAGQRLCMGRVILAAGGVGNFATVILRNRAGTGQLARITSIQAISSAGDDIVVGPTQNTLAAAGASAFSDTRVFGEGTALQLQGANNLLVVGSDFYRFRVSTAQFVLVLPPAIAVIAPGAGLSISSGTADLALTVSVTWVERVAQPSELNL